MRESGIRSPLIEQLSSNRRRILHPHHHHPRRKVESPFVCSSHEPRGGGLYLTARRRAKTCSPVSRLAIMGCCSSSVPHFVAVFLPNCATQLAFLGGAKVRNPSYFATQSKQRDCGSNERMHKEGGFGKYARRQINLRPSSYSREREREGEEARRLPLCSSNHKTNCSWVGRGGRGGGRDGDGGSASRSAQHSLASRF